MTTQDKIAKEIKEKYKNYAGRMQKPFIHLHRILRKQMGDEKFLEFLEKQTPPPKYELPDLSKINSQSSTV